MMSRVQEPNHDAQLLSGIRVALRKARELGCDVQQMDLTASVAEGRCAVYLAPTPKPDFIATGGNLSMTVDLQTDDVIECNETISQAKVHRLATLEP